MKLLVALTCVAATFAVGYSQLCEKAADCRPTECCIARSVGQIQINGVCVRKGTERRRCSEDDSKLVAFGDKYLAFCPCQEGLSCKPFNLRPGNTSRARYLASLRCQKSEATTTTVATIPTEADPDENKVPDPDKEGEDKDTKVAGGPGGERPRDDDCQNWEYPC